IRELGTSRGRGMAREVDVVLDREWNAVERQLAGIGALELGRARRELARLQPMDPDLVVAAARDALEDRRDQLRGPQAAGISLSQRSQVERRVRLQHAASIS